jgi:parafibromin
MQNFEPFLKNVMKEKIKALRDSLSGPTSKTAQSSSQPAYGMYSTYVPCSLHSRRANGTEQPRGAKKAKSNNPIIIISNSPTALVTMWNVKKLLEQGMYVELCLCRSITSACRTARTGNEMQS